MESSPANQSCEDMEIIDRLFLKFAALYGNTWRNTYKNPDFLAFTKNQWREALVGYEEKVLTQALNICREHHKFPPSVPEFIESCKVISRKNVFYVPENITKARPEVAALNLSKIRAILNIKPR